MNKERTKKGGEGREEYKNKSVRITKMHCL
jgi:hypothetical protein